MKFLKTFQMQELRSGIELCGLCDVSVIRPVAGGQMSSLSVNKHALFASLL